MSMIRCEDCSRLIDSDDDPDCFVYVGNYKRLHDDKVMCEPCRERYFEKIEADADQAAQAEYEATKGDTQ